MASWAAAAAHASASREPMYTRAPALTKPSAIARPMPLLPPVTNTLLPDTPNSSLIKSTGTVLQGKEYFPELPSVGDARAQVFTSSRSGGGDSMLMMYLIFAFTLYLLPPRLHGEKTAFEAQPKTSFTVEMK